MSWKPRRIEINWIKVNENYYSMYHNEVEIMKIVKNPNNGTWSVTALFYFKKLIFRETENLDSVQQQAAEFFKDKLTEIRALMVYDYPERKRKSSKMRDDASIVP